MQNCAAFLSLIRFCVVLRCVRYFFSEQRKTFLCCAQVPLMLFLRTTESAFKAFLTLRPQPQTLHRASSPDRQAGPGILKRGTNLKPVTLTPRGATLQAAGGGPRLRGTLGLRFTSLMPYGFGYLCRVVPNSCSLSYIDCFVSFW